MRKASDNAERGMLFAIALFLLAGLLRVPERYGSPMVSAILFLAINLIYIGIILVWSISIRQRLLQGSVRHFLLMVCALMVFWILLRACKYRYFDPIGIVLRYLWYGYYIPILFGPVFGFLAALCLGRSEIYHPAWAHHLLFIPSTMLCALVMTNDLHQLAFRFQPGFRDWSSEYTYGIVYYLSVAWIFGMVIACFLILQRKCRSAGGKRRFGIPALIFAAGFGLCLLSSLSVFWIYKVPELLCATYAATWEACIRVGLVPTNINYRGFFSVSTIAARIADSGGHTRYSARGAERLTDREMRLAQEGSVMLDEHTRLQAHPIGGGYVYWLSNISTISRMNDELTEKRALLTEEVEIARAENEIREQKTRIEEQNRVYDRMSMIASPQLSKLDFLVSGWTPDDPEYRNKLETACVLGAYIKRRLNLQLIADSAPDMQTEELYYCLRESAEYLSVGGILCKCVQDGGGTISSGAILLAYDFFQAAIESALPSLSSLLIRCGMRNGRMELRLVMEDAADTVAPDWRGEDLARMHGALDRQLSDGTLFYTLHMRRGGDAP